jgi:hypothetical protein
MVFSELKTAENRHRNLCDLCKLKFVPQLYKRALNKPEGGNSRAITGTKVLPGRNLRGVQSLNSRPGERQYYRYYSAIDTS